MTGIAPAEQTRSAPSAALLAIEGLTVRFGGLVAVDGLDLSVGEGRVAALVGPNGAGKTTSFNVIAGVQRPTEGQVLFDGSDIAQDSPAQRANLGIARTYQNLALVQSLSVLENVTVGLARHRRVGLLSSVLGVPRARAEDRRLRALATATLDFVGIAHLAHAPARSLPYGDRRRLELARALALGPRLLLVDEPSAGMDPAETAALAETIRRAQHDLGLAVLVVEHDMSMVRRLAETVTVLNFGRVIASGAVDSVLEDSAVVEAYLGTGDLTGA